MEWIKLESAFASEEKALQTADIVATTEARLANRPGGPQYRVETRIEQAEERQWQVYWRKVFVGYAQGCGGCQSCAEKPPARHMGKVIPFKKPTV